MRNILIVILIVLAGCATITQENIYKKDYSKPRNIVVLIHGIGGNYLHFGHLREALENHLSHALVTRSVEVVHFDYLTGNNQLTTKDFSRHLVRYLNGYFRTTSPIKKSDRISLVMHSQGGIVGMLWLLNTVSKAKGYPMQYFDQLDAFITLSTPFWGSNIVNLARKFYGYTYLPYGKRELEEMAFGSHTISHLRDSLIRYQSRLKRVRFLNVGAASSEKSDSDTLVDLPSMRQDFIYNKGKGFEELSLAKFHRVKAYHLNLLALMIDIDSWAGVSQAYRSCVIDLDCNHPSFKTIYDFLLGKKIKMESGGRSFYLGIELIGKGINRDDILIEFALPDPKMIELKTLHPSDYYQIEKPRSKFFHFSGKLKKSDYLQKETSLHISVPGFKTIKSRVRLKPAQSTFLTFKLLPE